MMPDQPVLRTPRLMLRSFTQADARHVAKYAGAPEVADATLNVPHPYEEKMAESWIAGHGDKFHDGAGVVYAITLQGETSLCGCVSLRVASAHGRAELGYWLGVPFWGRGYMTEAAGALVSYGFQKLDLHKIEATHMTRNPASGRVMEKIGMTREGLLLREHVFKNGVFEDLVVYGLVKTQQ